MFIFVVVFYGEVFDVECVVIFVCIWSVLVLFSWDLY